VNMDAAEPTTHGAIKRHLFHTGPLVCEAAEPTNVLYCKVMVKEYNYTDYFARRTNRFLSCSQTAVFAGAEMQFASALADGPDQQRKVTSSCRPSPLASGTGVIR
jgi:hypothetical protein